MDKISQYRKIIRQALDVYAKWSTTKDITAETIVDPEKDHFEVINYGWDGVKRIHDVVIHLDIIDGKIWVQHDATDRPVAEMLVEAGVLRDDIVLGFYSPRKRAMSGFAVA